MDQQHKNLVHCAVDGDRNALGELLEHYGPAVASGLFIGSTWRGLLDAGDVMQVTYLEAYLQIFRFDATRAESFPAWLRRMAENNLKDAISGLETRRNPSPRMQLDAYSSDTGWALFDLLTAGVGTPSRAARGNEAFGLLQQAIELLPPDYARTVQLYDLDGRPVDEVASLLGRSAGAVYMLRMRAHDRLREYLGNPSHILESSA